MNRAKLEKMMDSFGEVVEKEVEKAQERVAKHFEKIVQAQLDLWTKQYPRHEFYALEGNGTLSFNVKPALRCVYTSPALAEMFDYIPGHARRGAIAKILDEADVIQELYYIEERIAPGFYSGFKLEGKRG